VRICGAVALSITSEKADACISTLAIFRLTKQQWALLLTEILPISDWISPVVVCGISPVVVCDLT